MYLEIKLGLKPKKHTTFTVLRSDNGGRLPWQDNKTIQKATFPQRKQLQGIPATATVLFCSNVTQSNYKDCEMVWTSWNTSSRLNGRYELVIM